jgi:hypothetical protein
MNLKNLKKYFAKFKQLKLSDRIIFVLMITFLIVSVPFLIINHTDKNVGKISTFKCPEAYSTNVEAENSISDYLDQKEGNNLNITVHDIFAQRYDFLIKNNCTEAIKNLQNIYGVSTEEDIVDSEIQEFESGKLINKNGAYKCPEFYATDEGRRVALNDWTKDLIGNSSSISVKSINYLLSERYDFYVENNCTEELKINSTKEDYINSVLESLESRGDYIISM